MSALQTMKKLIFGETWVLPIGVVAVIALGGLVIRPATEASWTHFGGFVLLAGVACVLAISVARGAR